MSDFPVAGRLEDHPFAELSGWIFQESLTGELILESGDRRRTVWFLGGNPVAVVSPDPQDHLAQFLLEHGKISDDDARRLAELPETREALGGADYLPKETLNWGVKSRFVNICYDLFRWEEGDYGFHEGDPPRELFLLKVPAHSLIMKGVGLLGQAAVIDAVPDDAVCGAGPVTPADARYLNPDALQLLERCRPGRLVAEALAEKAADLDQSRRLLYALACLGLVTLSRQPATAPVAAPVDDESSGFFLDQDMGTPTPARVEPRGEVDHAEFSLEDGPASGDFNLNLPPLDAEYGSHATPASEFDAADTSEPTAGHLFDTEAGPGSFGSFSPDTTIDYKDELPATHDDDQGAQKEDSREPGRRFHVPRIVGIALGSLAAAGIIAFAGWWWMSESVPPPPPVKPPVKRPAPSGGTPTAAAPTPAPATAPSGPAPAAVPPPAPAPAPPAPPSTAATPGASRTNRTHNALETFRAGDFDGAAAGWEALLAEEHRHAFTVQVLTACQHDTIRDAQRSLSAQDFYLVTRKMHGRVCYRICVGTFDSRESAGRALAGLPGEYRAGGALIRPVAEVLDRDR